MATEGVRVNGVCYVKASGIDAWFSSFPRSSFSDSSGTTLAYYSPNSAYASGWQLVRQFQPVTGVPSFSYSEAPLPALESCDYTKPFFDGVAFGWLILTVLVAASSLVFIRRGAAE